MFINKTDKGTNNVCGKVLVEYREKHKISQRKLADMLQLSGLDIDKNAIQRIEAGKRFVTDIEIKHLSKTLNLTYEDLLDK